MPHRMRSRMDARSEQSAKSFCFHGSSLICFRRVCSALVWTPCRDSGYNVSMGGFFALIVFERVHGPPVEAVGMAFSFGVSFVVNQYCTYVQK